MTHIYDQACRYTVVSWRGIPSVVEARDQDGSCKVELGARFQALIDQVAMKERLAGTDEYLSHWSKGRAKRREGRAEDVARGVARELEAQFDSIRADALAER